MKLPLTLIYALTTALATASAWTTTTTSWVNPSASLVATGQRKHKRQSLSTRRLASSSETLMKQEKPASLFAPEQSKQQDAIKVQDSATTVASPAATPQPALLSLPTLASVLLATVGTFVLNNQLGMGPIRASSVVGLVSTLVLPEKLALAAFCGSFAGMAKMAVVPGVLASSVLGLTCAGMIALFDAQKWLVGVGGRLGFIAQCACTAQFLVTSLVLGRPSAAAALIGNTPLDFGALALQLPTVAVFSVLGALCMRYWKVWTSNKSKRLSNSVGAVSVTGLLASLALPASLAGPVFCGSFVAMSAPTKLATLKGLVAASALAGVAQQCLAGVMLGGWGGKLGTAALMGVLAFLGLQGLQRKPAQVPAAKTA